MAAQNKPVPTGTPVGVEVETDGIRRVAFSVMTADEIRACAACEVTCVDLFSGGVPVDGGLYDTRMGVADYGQRCGTCRLSNKECPGHFGMIELAVPVFNPLFVDYVKRVVRCVCIKCARACLPDSFVPRTEIPCEASLSHAAEESAKVRECSACGAARAERLVWNKLSISTFTYTLRNDSTQRELTSSEIYDILQRVSDADCTLIGLSPARSRPEAFMFKVLPVTPVAVRPPHRSGSQRRDDDITHKLSEIVKRNRAILNKQEAEVPPEETMPLINLLQQDVLQLIDNSGNMGIQARMKSTNRPLRSISSRLKGKEGRVRSNLMGKRVDFSARSVITAEPNISVDEVGVPIRIAMTLTFPEIVHAGNLERLQRAVANGPTAYPGARMLHQNGVVFGLDRAEKRVRTDLQLGDVVERHMIDGDVVLVNRQPSLHRMSFMCHRVRVMPYDTLRLNVLVTEPYGADFDGDEMNVHLPQSASTAIEISRLAAVRSQIVSPRHHRPIIGVVQDVALGIYLLTRDDVMVDVNTAANISARCSEVMPSEPLTGRALFSNMLPTTLHCEMKGASVQHGELVTGPVGKPQFQQESCGILHSVFVEDGQAAAINLLDNAQAMACSWLSRCGFSMSARDVRVSMATRARVADLADQTRRDVDQLLRDMHTGKLRNQSTATDVENLERCISAIVERSLAAAIKAVEADLDASGSRMLAMVRSKSKGNPKNVVQMAGMLGQNFVEGNRMPTMLGDRALPHFARHDESADARGFISSSFLAGLRPHEFMFHAMAGREGLIDTAVKSVSGDTRIVVMAQSGRTETLQIGAWVDRLMARSPGEVKHFPDERNMEFLTLASEEQVFIPGTDDRGGVAWRPLTAVTRHDPGERIFRVRTAAGRNVTVADSKTLLVWDPQTESFQAKASSDVRAGDKLPVTSLLPRAPESAARAALVGCEVPLDARAGVAAGLRMARTDAMIQPARESAMAAFLNRSVGPFGSDTMRVPQEMCAAPLEFVRAMLSAFLANSLFGRTHGSVTSEAIADRDLADGLVMACARVGICATLAACPQAPEAVRLSVEGSKADIFHRWIFGGLQSAEADTTGKVALDEVTEIEPSAPAGFAKLYDVTVPDTLNFALADGLHVRDTSETGYLQRKLVKALEDLQVAGDGSVRDASHAIVSFRYGGDGMDACAIETQSVPSFGGGMEWLAVNYLLSDEDVPELEQLLAPEALAAWRAEGAARLERARDHFVDVVQDKHFAHEAIQVAGTLGEGTVAHAINYARIITRWARTFNPRQATSNLNPSQVLDAANTLVAELYTHDQVALYRQHGKDTEDAPRAMGAVLVRAHISPKMLIRQGVTQRALEAIVQTVRHRFYSGLVSASEMVGVLAAQSISEPATQLNLSSFHNTGLAKQRASVPRVKELVGVSKNPKQTNLVVALVDGLSESPERAGAIRDRILATHVRDLFARSQMVCENGEHASEVDARLVLLEHMFPPPSGSEADCTGPRFILRIELDRARMTQHAVSMLDVHTAIYAKVHGDVVSSDDVSDPLVVRVAPRLDRVMTEDADLVAELRAMEAFIMDLKIKGVSGIEACVVAPPGGQTERCYDPALADYTQKARVWVEAASGARASVDDFMAIARMPEVDASQTMTDNLCHVHAIFGVEAARSILLSELQGAFSNDTYADFRHVELLVDYITRRGALTAVTRHGIGASNAGPLTKASFEQTVVKLAQAGAFAESDTVSGVSANVMLGQTLPCGTGKSVVLWDAQDASRLPDGQAVVSTAKRAPLVLFSVDPIMHFKPFAPSVEAIPWVSV